MSRLQPLPSNTTLAELIVRTIKNVVVHTDGANGKVNVKQQWNWTDVYISATVSLFSFKMILVKQGRSYKISELTSDEKFWDEGSPHAMPMEWFLTLALAPGEQWVIKDAMGVLALFEAYEKWAKVEEFPPVFNLYWKDKNI